MNQRDDQQSLGVLDALDTGLIVLDADARVLTWNAWLVSASGISAQAAVGKRLEDLFPGALPTSLTSAISDAQGSGASRLLTHSLNPVLFPLSTQSRQELIHNVSVRPLGPAPHCRCLVQIVDVTMAVRREQVLRARQNARYDAVVNSAPDAILTLDAQGVIQFANPAAAQEFGYATQDLVGLDMAILLDAPEPWGALWTSVLAEDVLHRPVEITARRKDGSASFLEVSASRWQSDTRVYVTAILGM